MEKEITPIYDPERHMGSRTFVMFYPSWYMARQIADDIERRDWEYNWPIGEYAVDYFL